MNHQPTQLALLISLIGVGVSPLAHASAHLADPTAGGAVQSLPGVTCDEFDAAAVQTCGGLSELVWQPARSPIGLPATAGVRLFYTASHDDWAPGETLALDQPGAADESPGRWVPRQKAAISRPTGAQATSKLAEVRDALRPTSRKQAAAKARKVRVIAEAPSAARVTAQPLARADLSIERLQRIERIERQPAVFVGAVSTAVESPAVGSGEASRPPVEARISEAGSVQTERPAIAVDTQTNVVLRNLGAILSEERDEVGAIRPDAPAPTGASQTSKVMEMLGEITSAQPVVEDGPARRLRKLAARAAKAEPPANVDTHVGVDFDIDIDLNAIAAASLATEVAQNGVDLMLPLEAPTLAAPLPTVAAALAPPIEQLPVATESERVEPLTVRQPRANPFGDRQVAVAVSEHALDRVRGGFSGDGLNISFGIERAVYVNGALVTTTSLNVSDLGRVSAGRGTASHDIGSMGLIQSGAGNLVSPNTSVSAGAISTVVQNTLDGQKIQNITVINATVNSLGVLRGLNLQSSLRGAVIDSLRR